VQSVVSGAVCHWVGDVIMVLPENTTPQPVTLVVRYPKSGVTVTVTREPLAKEVACAGLMRPPVPAENDTVS
jgi:hypothetical protein